MEWGLMTGNTDWCTIIVWHNLFVLNPVTPAHYHEAMGRLLHEIWIVFHEDFTFVDQSHKQEV